MATSWTPTLCARRRATRASRSSPSKRRLRAALQLVADFREEIDFGCPRGFVLLAYHLVRRPDDQEDDKGEDDEVDHHRDELAPAQHRHAGLLQRGIIGRRAGIIGWDRAQQCEVAREVETSE